MNFMEEFEYDSKRLVKVNATSWQNTLLEVFLSAKNRIDKNLSEISRDKKEIEYEDFYKDIESTAKSIILNVNIKKRVIRIRKTKILKWSSTKMGVW